MMRGLRPSFFDGSSCVMINNNKKGTSKGRFYMKIKEVIVVEGKDDTAKIKQAVEADTLETGGSALNKVKLETMRLAQERRGLIIFTDPDYPGQRLRNLISQAIPGCYHAFLPRNKARSKQGKIGIEHATSDAIRQALNDVRLEEDTRQEKSNQTHPVEEVPWSLILEYGLVGGSRAKQRRIEMGKQLGIGYANAKQFYKRLQMFRISYQEFQQQWEIVTRKEGKS